MLIAPSFADIFFNNCFKNGLLPIILPESAVAELRDAVLASPGYELEVDLQSQSIQADSSPGLSFEVDPFRKKCLLQGLDDVDLSLQLADRIQEFESARPSFRSLGSS